MKHFIDAGANIGQTFEDFLIHRPEFDGGTVWLVEPSLRHLPALMETAAQFGHRYTVKVCPFGLWGITQLLGFYPKDDERGDSFFPYLKSDHETTNLDLGFKMVQCGVGVADMLAGFTPEDEVTLKLDVEGSEYEILCVLLHNPQLIPAEIYVEWHDIGVRPVMERADIENAFTELGKPLKRWMF